MTHPLTTWRWAEPWALKAEPGDRANPQRAAGAPPPAADGADAPKSKYAGNTPEARSARARHAALVRYGKENPMQARLAKIRAARKAKAKKGGTGKAKAAPKPQEEEGKTAQEIANENRARVAEETGVGKDLDGAMARLNAGMGGKADEANGDKLVAMGLAKKDPTTGRYSLSPDGKKYYAAAKKGDADAARVAIGAAKDRVAGGAAKDKATADAKAEKDKAAAEKKPKGGGGGGGGKGKKDEKKEEAPAADDAKAKARALVRDSTAREVGLKPYESAALRAAADGGQVDEADIDGLAEQGLVEPDGAGGFITTDSGRRALNALERGDKAGYRAALQDVKAKKDRAAERDTVRKGLDAARAERERERAAGEAGRQKEKDAAEAQEFDDLADDYRAKRKGLSMKDQRRLVRAGRATFGKDGRFALSATKSMTWRWAAKETR